MNGFIVFASCRSRTLWLSRFLSYRDWRCGHDEVMHMRTKDDLVSWYRQPNIGSVETAVAPFWRLISKQWPNLKIVVLRRNVDAVIESVEASGVVSDRDAMVRTLRRADQKLAQIENRLPVLSVRYEDLPREEVCAEVFEHCLPYQHDTAWWHEWDQTHISGDLLAQRRYAVAYLPQLMKLTKAARQMSMAALAPKTREADGVSFSVERFDDWFRDAQELFRNHMVATGQDVDDFRKKNIPIARKLDQMGMMQIVTARMNGRMFGYQLSVIGPSLDEDHWVAQHLPLYASPDLPGLGLKIEREADKRLRERGVRKVFGRAGIRGSGPKLGALYRRLGYEDYGQLYCKDLQWEQ